MTLNDNMNNILVLGVGDAGADLARKIQATLNCRGAVINTDESALENAEFSQRLLIGAKTCKGRPAKTSERGRKAAEESINDIEQLLCGVSILVLTGGLGRGIGSGAMPVIAKKAVDLGIEVTAAVTSPSTDESFAICCCFAIFSLSNLKKTGVKVLAYDYETETKNPDDAPSVLHAKAAEKLSEMVSSHLNQRQSKVTSLATACEAERNHPPSLWIIEPALMESYGEYIGIGEKMYYW